MRWRLITLSSPIKDKYFHEWLSQPIVSTPEISSFSDTKSCRYVEHLFQCEIFRICDGMTIVQVILSNEYCWFQCYRHEHSQCHRMFFVVVCNIHRRSFLSFPHSIIHPAQEWSGFHWQFQFCFIVSNGGIFLGLATSWELISSGRPDLSQSVSSFLTDCAVPSRRISSWSGRTFSYHSPKSFIRLPWSIVRLHLSFPLLRRPSTVVISMNCSWFWWSEASNKSVALSGRPDLSSFAIELHGSWFP